MENHTVKLMHIVSTCTSLECDTVAYFTLMTFTKLDNHLLQDSHCEQHIYCFWFLGFCMKCKASLLMTV